MHSMIYININHHLHIQYEDDPLGIAAGKGHTQTVQRLLEAGANINYQDKVITMCIHIIIKLLTIKDR